MGTKGSLCIKQITNLKIAEFFLKKWEFIVAIKSQLVLSTFCPATKLYISGVFLKTVLIKQIIVFNLGYIYHCYLIHISEVNELHERHKRIKLKNDRQKG